jgi:hypothetical protein
VGGDGQAAHCPDSVAGLIGTGENEVLNAEHVRRHTRESGGLVSIISIASCSCGRGENADVEGNQRESRRAEPGVMAAEVEADQCERRAGRFAAEWGRTRRWRPTSASAGWRRGLGCGCGSRGFCASAATKGDSGT